MVNYSSEAKLAKEAKVTIWNMMVSHKMCIFHLVLCQKSYVRKSFKCFITQFVSHTPHMLVYILTFMNSVSDACNVNARNVNDLRHSKDPRKMIQHFIFIQSSLAYVGACVYKKNYIYDNASVGWYATCCVCRAAYKFTISYDVILLQKPQSIYKLKY